jgi:hypothetical protein
MSHQPAGIPRWTLAAFGVIAALLAAQTLLVSGSLIDDAFIFFRYADNLLAGHGPVFNAGERVEGFTSPLWLILLTAGRAAGLSYETLVTVLGVVLAVAALLPVWLLARQAAPPGIALLAPLLLAIHPGFAMWAVHGLETALFVALFTTAWWVAGREAPSSALIAGTVLGLALWTRPEAGLALVVLAGLEVARGRHRRAIHMLGGFVALAIPLALGRLAYYRQLLPNTYHAKSGGGWGRLQFGLGEARRFAVAHAPLAVACAAAAGWALITTARGWWVRSSPAPSPAAAIQERSGGGRAAAGLKLGWDVRFRRMVDAGAGDGKDPAGSRSAATSAPPWVVFQALALGVVWTLWVITVGGDGFFGYRFWLPVLPAAGVVLSWGVAELARAAGRRRDTAGSPSSGPGAAAALAVGAIVLLVATAAGALPEANRERISGAEFTARMTAAGLWLSHSAPAETTLALNYVGALPYFSRLPAIDMLGLTDPVVARTPIRGRFRFPGHARGNGAAILDRRPELILMNGVYLEPQPLTALAPQLDSEEQIVADPRFAAEYELVNVPLATPAGRLWFGFYKRKDFPWTPAP